MESCVGDREVAELAAGVVDELPLDVIHVLEGLVDIPFKGLQLVQQLVVLGDLPRLLHNVAHRLQAVLDALRIVVHLGRHLFRQVVVGLHRLLLRGLLLDLLFHDVEADVVLVDRLLGLLGVLTKFAKLLDHEPPQGLRVATVSRLVSSPLVFDA